MNERVLAGPRFESIASRTERAEGGVGEKVALLIQRLEQYRPAHTKQETAPLTLEALNTKYQKVHERIMKLGVAPASVAFMVAGFFESQAKIALDSTLAAEATLMNLSAEQADALLTFSKSGMAGAGVAVSAALVLAMANTGLWASAERALKKQNHSPSR